MHRALKEAIEVFEALSSPVRTQILRLLISRGPLTYSEIMEKLNLKPSKDAGKFVYHLKSLVSAGLITLDKESRRYKVTELGSMVNEFFQQLAEYSLRKGGKLLVRTSRYMIEEFNREKITASLVEEAGVPPETADKISAEAEERLLKLPIRYLTAPLIRELVNAILLEKGYEEYRHKLTRLGMPVHDVTLKFREAAEKGLTVDSVFEAAGGQVLREYMLLSVLPREVADAHLSGQIHLSNSSVWLLKPASVHHDLRHFFSGEFKPLSPLAPASSPPETFSEALELTIGIIEAFSGEVSEGQTLEYFNIFLAPYLKGITSERARTLIEFFLYVAGFKAGAQTISLGLEASVPEHLQKVQVPGRSETYGDFADEALKILHLLVEAKLKLAKCKPPLNLCPILKIRSESLTSKLDSVLEKAHELASNFGLLHMANLTRSEASYSAAGECLSLNWSGDWEVDLVRCGCLDTVCLNLPRVAYEARGDKDRFLKGLRQAFEIAIKALKVKAEIVKSRLDERLLPNLSQPKNGEAYFRLENSTWNICLLGLNEAVKAHLGYELDEELVPQHFALEILESLKEASNEYGGARITLTHIVEDEASQRLASLDAEAYGWSKVIARGGRENPYYSYVPLVPLRAEAEAENRLKVEARLQPLFDGGHFTPIPVKGKSAKALLKRTKTLCEDLDLKFFAYDQPITYCPTCNKTMQGLKVKCPSCGSVKIEVYARQSTRLLPLKWWSHKGKLEELKAQT